jgi:hypothetical protein
MTKKCKHEKIKSQCKDCGGSQICEHNKFKSSCKECGGSQFCKHDKFKYRCKECKGIGICKHNKRKTHCKECNGSVFCEHNKQKSRCKKCGGSQICEHDKRKETCKECDGSGICEHGKIKIQCRACEGSQICQHDKVKSICKECDGSQICEHDKQKYQCIICTPDSKAFCKSCRLFLVKKKTNYLCSYCNPEKSKRQKTKEICLKTFLEENNYKFIYNKKCNLDNSCQTYYPDFLIDCNTFFLIIECDENAHNSYNTECEKIRENNICYALGLPCVFIRYNPDKKGIKMKIKEKILKSYIDFYISKEKCNNEVQYLFY